MLWSRPSDQVSLTSRPPRVSAKFISASLHFTPESESRTNQEPDVPEATLHVCSRGQSDHNIDDDAHAIVFAVI
jgi:hypothetical protein